MFLKKLVATRRFFGLLLFVLTICVAQNTLAASTISGTVYDKQRNSLVDVDVELLNDFYQQIGRTRTDGTGRYQFDGLRDGRYSVRVLAFRYDLQDETQQVEIITLSTQGTQGSSFQLVDFYLLPRKGGLADAELGVIFAQEIPQEAKKTYEKALGDFSKKRTNEGILGLSKAIEIFPDYYSALHRLGQELYILKKYQESAQFFFKAAQINQKSATSFYFLGYSLHRLGAEYNPAALAALKQAYTLAPASAQVLYVLGKVERASGNFENAEKHLLQAKKVSKVSVPDIHKELAQLYGNDMKKYSEAADELELYLKNSKPNDAESKQTKKIIGDLREKAKATAGK